LETLRVSSGGLSGESCTLLVRVSCSGPSFFPSLRLCLARKAVGCSPSAWTLFQSNHSRFQLESHVDESLRAPRIHPFSQQSFLSALFALFCITTFWAWGRKTLCGFCQRRPPHRVPPRLLRLCSGPDFPLCVLPVWFLSSFSLRAFRVRVFFTDVFFRDFGIGISNQSAPSTSSTKRTSTRSPTSPSFSSLRRSEGLAGFSFFSFD